tara:strand:+ start:305 stop:547 length:243 start_codon:yes stop_codon:yes gene_type:complete
MKVGDIVKQKKGIIRKSNKPYESKAVGIVVDIREIDSEDRGKTSESILQMISMIGRKVDVLWESGKLTENFAESSLEVVD